MEDKKHKVIFVEPSTLKDFDTEVMPLEKDTWEEVSDKIEQILEAHYLDAGWSGELNIHLQFKELTQMEINNLTVEI